MRGELEAVRGELEASQAQYAHEKEMRQELAMDLQLRVGTIDKMRRENE